MFVLFAVVVVFVSTVSLLSTDGVLPGNDPAVHLDMAKTIVANEGVAYSDIFWYPPLFHAFLATLLLFAGTVDIMVASLLLKLTVATINVLLLLSTYLLCRRLFGKGVAICSTVFTAMSVPIFEMIFWGGYPNLLGIAYFPFVFYVMYENYRVWVKTSILLLSTFALVLTHQIAAFVFLPLFITSFLITSIRSRRSFLAFVTVVLGGSLALLAWYAEVIGRYFSTFIYHVFFEIKGVVYIIPSVSVDSFVKFFGITLALTVIGIPLTLLSLKRKGKLSAFILLALWITIPFFLSQSYLVGLYLPYDRFVYFLVTPIAAFSGVTAYSFAKLPAFTASKLTNRSAKSKRLLLAQALALMILVGLFSSQLYLSIPKIQSYPKYYQVTGIADYEAGMWLKQNFLSNGTVVVSQKPGNWLRVISDRETIEQSQSSVYGNAIAETILNLFYETDNTRALTREYTSSRSGSGQAVYVPVYHLWTKVLSIQDSYVFVTYLASDGKETSVSLSDTAKETHLIQKSVEEAQLITKYSSPLFTLEKLVTVSNSSAMIDIEWKLTAHQDLANVKLRVFNMLEPSLDFKEAFVPGVLNWQNPWDNYCYHNPVGDFVLTECPPLTLVGNYTAVLDAKNGVMAIFEFPDNPDWLGLGALSSHFIDAVRVGYNLGDLGNNDSRKVSFSVLPYSFESEQVEAPAPSFLRLLLNSKMNLTVQERDFLTYIKELNVKFLVIDNQHVSSDIESSPFLYRVYDNGKLVIFAVREQVLPQ